MMTPKRYDTLRLQLIRLYQAMEQHTDLAGEMFRDSTNTASETGSQDPSTFRVLPSIGGNRQHVRIKDRLPVIYSESPEIAEQVVLDSSLTKSTVDFSEWLQEIAGQKGQRINPLHGMEMRIHLQKFEEELIYFIAFQERGPDRKGPVPLREIEISGSGMSFPTEIAHHRGEDILIVYFLPTDPFPPLQIASEIVRPSRPHHRGGHQTPVKVVDISQEDRHRIMEYMASRQRQKSLAKAYDLRS
ncbi:MAG: PilZ domain-containing protein [Thermodesulfobacteriota bacterium]